MTAAQPDRVTIRSTDGLVQVEGLTQEQVEFALDLAREVQDEQVRARSALSAHVNQVMLSREIPLVPRPSQRQVQRNAELRRRLLGDEGAETYASLAELRGTSESSVRTWVARKRQAAELFTVDVQGRTIVPSVLLTSSGKLDHHVAEILRPLLRAGLDGWPLWAWLTSPSGLLSGEIPAEVAHTNMPRAHRAAQRHAATLRDATADDHDDHPPEQGSTAEDLSSTAPPRRRELG